MKSGWISGGCAICRWFVIAAGLVVASEVAQGQPGRAVVLELDACMDGTAAIADVIAIELGVRIVEDSPADRSGATRAGVRCRGPVLALWADDPTTGRSLSRDLHRDVVDAGGGARLVGQALAELLTATWLATENAPVKHDTTTPAIPTRDPREDTRIGDEAVVVRDWQISLMAGGRIAFGGSESSTAPSVRLYLDAPAVWGLSATATRESRSWTISHDGGMTRSTTTVTDASVWLGAHVHGGPRRIRLRAGGSARLGLGQAAITGTGTPTPSSSSLITSVAATGGIHVTPWRWATVGVGVDLDYTLTGHPMVPQSDPAARSRLQLGISAELGARW